MTKSEYLALYEDKVINMLGYALLESKKKENEKHD